MKKQKNSKETNVVCFVYSKNLLDFLLKIGLISNEEHSKAITISAEYYNIKNICLN